MSAWFLDSELSTCVIVLLLTSECKSAATQYTNTVIIWRLRKVFQENKLRLLPLCKPLFIVNVRVKGLLKLYWSIKTKRLTSKSGRGTCITRLYKR